MISERERFLAQCFSSHPLFGDAVVVLCGEDGAERLQAGVHAFAQSSRMVQEAGGNAEAVHLVLSGGVSGEGKQSAKDLEPSAWQYGVSPSRIILDTDSQNTHEQAVNVARIAKERSWRRIVLVCSPYHTPRAFLTFVKAFQGTDCQILPKPATHLKWNEKPEGSKYTRDELLSGEAVKIAMYPEHIASYGEGLEYIARWER